MGERIVIRFRLGNVARGTARLFALAIYVVTLLLSLFWIVVLLWDFPDHWGLALGQLLWLALVIACPFILRRTNDDAYWEDDSTKPAIGWCIQIGWALVLLFGALTLIIFGFLDSATYF